MIEKLAMNMACFYVGNNYIPSSSLKAYKYGFEVLLSTVCNIGLVLGISIITRSFSGAICYMAAFVLMRRVGGGYHAKNHGACISLFAASFVFFSLVIKHLDSSLTDLFNLTCGAVCLVVLWRVAPVAAPNKPLSPKKKKRYEIISLAAGSGFLAVAIATYLIDRIPDGLVVYLFAGELAAILSMVAAAIKGKGKRNNEEHDS